MRTEFAEFYQEHPEYPRRLTRRIAKLFENLRLHCFKRALSMIETGSERWHREQQRLAIASSTNHDCAKRALFYMHSLNECGELLYVLPGTIMCFPKRIRIGRNVFINRNVYIVARDDVRIGDNVLIGPNVVINSGSHNYKDARSHIRDQGHKAAPISIGNDVWLAANVIVLPGVRIGDGAVIGAGAVVTKDIEPYSIAVGVPANVVAHRK